VYLDPDGCTSLLDWQLVQRGPWYLDVGYHIATMLTVEDRRSHEAALIGHYLERLAAAGIDPPDGGAVEHGVRRGLIHGFYLWGITLKVKPEIIASLLERLGTAVDDHGGWSEIGAGPDACG
jgi:Ecdysteroid kinase-like family